MKCKASHRSQEALKSFPEILNIKAMRKLYVFIRTEYGLKSKIIDQLSKLKGVLEVVSVHGEYDLLLKAEVKSLDELNELVYNGVRSIRGVVSTATMICANIE